MTSTTTTYRHPGSTTTPDTVTTTTYRHPGMAPLPCPVRRINGYLTIVGGTR